MVLLVIEGISLAKNGQKCISFGHVETQQEIIEKATNEISPNCSQQRGLCVDMFWISSWFCGSGKLNVAEPDESPNMGIHCLLNLCDLSKSKLLQRARVVPRCLKQKIGL